ncbi:MAG TPA: HAD family hydrolase [Terriglobales bacterium]|nr:HAD family hydrolase [Terriglobales bacterium]
MRPNAVFFDVGNTLLFPNRKLMLRGLHDLGIFPSEDLLQKVERRTKPEFDSLLESNSSIDHSFWQIYYSRLLDELKLSDPSVCNDLVACTRISANWCEIRPDTREILQRLRRNYRLAVISNADGKIADVLARCGIADLFETITDSGIVGKEKPHPAIFEAAVRSLNVSPAASLYVGDVYSVDYLGATRYGMESILFDVAGAYRDRDLARVESLAELEARLA